MMHLLNAGATVLSFLNLTLSGIFFALYAIKDGNIYGVCGLHMGWNFAQGNIYGTYISGEPSTNAIFHCKEAGSRVLTGGTFGPEGGLVTSVFLLLGILLVGYAIYKQQKAV